MDEMLWLLEPDVFGPGEPPLADAARRAGHGVVVWRDEWWASQEFPDVTDSAVVFHGSLGNASRIAEIGRWKPGAFCDVPRFRWSAWAPSARSWLLSPVFLTTTVRELAAAPANVVAALEGVGRRVFVRPDSPLKPFSGRVVDLEGLTPEHLDHGFYYDDLDLPIVVAPTTTVGREWRFVVAHRQLVTGCEYVAEGRKAAGLDVDADIQGFVAGVAAAIDPPEAVYVLDVAETETGPRLVELNPFSGADLYSSDPGAVVAAVADCVSAR